MPHKQILFLKGVSPVQIFGKLCTNFNSWLYVTINKDLFPENYFQNGI